VGKYDQRLGPVALGDEFVIEFPLKQANGQAWSPAATQARFMGKRAVDDPDADAVLSEQLGGGVGIAGSTATVRVEQPDQATLDGTTTLYWSFRITTAADGEQTVAAGTLLLQLFAVRT
jgi:hypothetical protein